jgi:hypothetical protein
VYRSPGDHEGCDGLLAHILESEAGEDVTRMNVRQGDNTCTGVDVPIARRTLPAKRWKTPGDDSGRRCRQTPFKYHIFSWSHGYPSL